MKKEVIVTTIRELSDQLIKNWPLYSFVTSNPLAGLEHLHFEDAISRIRSQIGISGYPSSAMFEQVWNRGEINRSLVEQELLEREITLSVEESLDKLKKLEQQLPDERILGEVDRHMIKWLTVFLDQGSTEWGMPNRGEGFYEAWRMTARFDHTLPNRGTVSTLPDTPLKTLQQLLDSYRPDDLRALFRHHLLSLPGWTGYIKYRIDNSSDWQHRHPITLLDYLAVRLAVCLMHEEDVFPANVGEIDGVRNGDRIRSAWLQAMERTYQQQLVTRITAPRDGGEPGKAPDPEAQFVFCIDTRSERIRRAVEQSGNYQTFGYAGFFGVAMDYRHPEKSIRHKSCPPILESVYEVTEQVRPQQNRKASKFTFYNNLKNALNKFRFTLKNNIPASFGYVESAGFFYGLGLLLKTILPAWVDRFGKQVTEYIGQPEEFCDPVLHQKNAEEQANALLSVAEKTAIAKAAFDLMGWDHFAPLVVFAGHGSETANNPFGSSLDCGACAGNRGRHNARVLADICNDTAVRDRLAKQHGIRIPGDTLFLAAEHNTTTNHIQLFDDTAPEACRSQIRELQRRLENAQQIANREQFNMDGVAAHSTAEACRRAADWAETRPEWGLAGNASFIIGPRELTSGLNLEARSFLHSYNWEKDPDGQKLEAILQGPMVVTQWINNHYYFATVDNDYFGSGSKVTQNVTGKYGVVQGNGGDLKCGLPLESLREDDNLLQHLPLRLTVLIHAPRTRVESILEANRGSLGRLVSNEWIYLAVMDPEEGNSVSFIEEHPAQLVNAAGAGHMACG
ncbi:MAG: DUF2309 domain-containing protein [Balneolaceae bacterium]|nr:DUF2309 domain-containing protein [Balneolaceae bacterium]